MQPMQGLQSRRIPRGGGDEDPVGDDAPGRRRAGRSRRARGNCVQWKLNRAAVAMDTTVTLPQIASLVARNLVPAAGVLVLGWSAANLLILYYLDTVLEFAVVVLLVARHVTGLGRVGERTRSMGGPLDWIRAGAGSLFAAVLIGLPLGVPLFMFLASVDWSWQELADRGFLAALAMQVVGSLTAAARANRELLARADDERVLKYRAAFIFARWLAVGVAGVVVPFGLLGPRIGGALLVLVYAGATVYFDLFPKRALEWLNPKEVRADERRDAEAARKADDKR